MLKGLGYSGSAYALYWFASLDDGKTRESARALYDAAMLGFAPAQVAVGRSLSNSADPVKWRRGLELAIKAKAQGDEEAKKLVKEFPPEPKPAK